MTLPGQRPFGIAFNADGSRLLVATGFFRPTGIAFVGNAIWIADIKGDFIPGQQLPDGTVFRIVRD